MQPKICIHFVCKNGWPCTNKQATNERWVFIYEFKLCRSLKQPQAFDFIKYNFFGIDPCGNARKQNNHGLCFYYGCFVSKFSLEWGKKERKRKISMFFNSEDWYFTLHPKHTNVIKHYWNALNEIAFFINTIYPICCVRVFSFAFHL